MMMLMMVYGLDDDDIYFDFDHFDHFQHSQLAMFIFFVGFISRTKRNRRIVCGENTEEGYHHSR